MADPEERGRSEKEKWNLAGTCQEPAGTTCSIIVRWIASTQHAIYRETQWEI